VRLLILILSWSWVILGIWWFFRPAGIRRRFEKRYRKGARWLLLTVLIVSAGILFAVARQLGGLLGILLAILGSVALLKGLLFARGKVSDVVLDWWGAQPTWVYRVAAACLFVLGLLMQAVLKWGAGDPGG